MCYFKGFLPDINGQEKFMDYGFIMSMLRNGSLPANDMWLAGYSINSYYFGQYIWAVVIKATNIPSGVGYNLAMCSATALPFAMSFSIGKFMIEAASKRGFKDNKIIKYIAGFFTGCAVSLWGNSHSFYYDEKSVGNRLLEVFKNMGIDVGRTDRFFYPDSTRFLYRRRLTCACNLDDNSPPHLGNNPLHDLCRKAPFKRRDRTGTQP